VLGVLFGPLLEDATSAAEHLARRLVPGLVGGAQLELEVRLAFAGRNLCWHIRQKLLGALGLGLLLADRTSTGTSSLRIPARVQGGVSAFRCSCCFRYDYGPANARSTSRSRPPSGSRYANLAICSP
jgi:hypothetical protein